ncbi:MAG: SDR family oxidoreductase [Actinomycetia bacterium]|nr:SDR family oxidoreductase [Actinomycetes bacterium]
MGVLDGQVALVTGASKGIGSELARGLAAEGASVAVNYKHDAAGAQQTCASIADAGGRAIPLSGDVSSGPGACALVNETVEQLGRIDVLVNNAARTRFGPALDVTDKDFDDVVNTNMRGTFFASTEAARHMLEQGSGSIINISTCAVRLQIEWHSVYTMSKGGIEALTAQLAYELAPTVRVNAIAPGPTKTARSLEYDPNQDETWGKIIPLGRMCLPSDYVGPLIFLASDQSAFLSGEVLHVDGAWNLQGKTPPMGDLDLSGDFTRD